MLEIKLNVKLPDVGKTAEQIRQGLVAGMRLGMAVAEDRAKTRMGNPGEIGVRTGNLRRSITAQVKEDGNDVVGSLYSNVDYARIHEEGGNIPAHIIRPRYRMALKFVVDGKTLFRKSVLSPARYQQAHPYLRPSINENLERIRQLVIRSIIGEVENGI